MEKGTLIEYRVHAERRLAVAERPDGKKNWIVIDEFGQSQSIRPQQVSYEIAKDGYKPSDLANFRKEVEPLIDPDSVEVAWEILVEDSEAVSPAEMALLLFSDQTPAQCYAAYSLLSQDKLFFKQKGDRYEPRPASQVAELKHQKEVEETRQRD